MNILVVDDDVMMAESVAIGLQNSGYLVFVAFSGQQVLEQLAHGVQRIDLLITDYLMPAMTGIDLLIAIRRRYSTLPVMIMTGYAETKLVIEALTYRCDGFIEKPFRLDQLITEIERIQQYIRLPIITEST